MLKLNFKNISFIKSAPSVFEGPDLKLPEILICGKSNVGKSSLINALTARKNLAFTSSKPGHTKLLNYYLIDNKAYLVDAPGYGYAKGGVDLDALFAKMMNEYFTNSKNLKLVLLLVDSRRELSEDDLEIFSFVKEQDVPLLLVVTKDDKINQSEKYKITKEIEKLELNKEKIFFVSIKDNKKLDALKSGIEKNL